MLPQGVNRSLVIIWNGTTDGGGKAYVPLDRLAPIARKWAEKGFGEAHVGLEVIATYSNSTAFLTRFLLVTYTPEKVIKANNPLGWPYYSKTVEVRLEQVRINARRGNSAGSHGFSALQPTPPPPSPLLCAYFGMPIWIEVWDYQTPTMYIPIIWLYDQMGYNAGGQIDGFVSSSTTTDFAAGLALTPSTELSSSDISNAHFEFAGTSFSTTTSANNFTGWGYLGYSYYPTSAALYVQGLGTAEFQVYCYYPDAQMQVPVDYYAVEVYIQSADLSQLYSSGSVGTAPVNNILNILSQYGYLGYYPLDYYQVPYGYGFINVQQDSNWGFSWSIPAGALLWSALQEAGAALPPYSEAIAAALMVAVSFSSTTTTVQAVSFTVLTSSPPYGDVLVSHLTIPYQNGGDFQPFMVGVIVEPSTSYTVSTTLAISGPTNVVPIQCGLYNVTFYVYPYIGSSPLLVPGGSVNYQIYDDATGQLVASGNMGVPWQKPAAIQVVLPSGTYTLVVQYTGCNDGPIIYQPSTSQIQTTFGEEC